MIKFDWPYFSALLSVAFGWFLNELSQWVRTRKEDRKVKKKVLFFLLETHFTFNKLDTGEIIDLLTKKVLDRVPKSERTSENEEILNKLYTSIISGLIEDNVAESIEEIEGNYTTSINELSALDPVTAHRLKGKNRILQVFELLNKYYDEVKEEFPDEPSLDEQIASTVDRIKPEIIQEAISDLEREIVSISLSINLLTWYRTKKVIHNTKAKIRKDDEKRIEELLDMLIPNSTDE